MKMQYLQSGSPTVELFAASYNNRSNKSNTIELGLGTYGYTQNTESGWLSTTDNYGIYNKSTSSIWWLASPDVDKSYFQLFVLGEEGCLAAYDVEDENCRYSVRPIVCIPTSVFDGTYTLENK